MSKLFINPKYFDPIKIYQGYLLGFDFGFSSIGIAAGQTLTKEVKPLGVMKAEKGIIKDKLILDAYIADWQPKALVVGIPLKMDDGPLYTTAPALRFAQTLKLHTGLPVHAVDERLTTKVARAHLFETAGESALQKEKIDAFSAAFLLKAWLEMYVP